MHSGQPHRGNQSPHPGRLGKPRITINLRQSHLSAAMSTLQIVSIVGAVIVGLVLLYSSVSRASQNALIAQSTARLAKIGAVLHMYVADNQGLLPAANGPANPTGGYWMLEFNPYVGGATEGGVEGISEFFTDPIYAKLLGHRPPAWRGGYSMNRRMQHVLGIRRNNHTTYGSNRVPLTLFENPQETVFVSMGYYEGFDPRADGSVPDERFSDNILRKVAHTKRIGANSQGMGGHSALYLFLDGQVRQLTPDQARPRLELRLSPEE